MDSTRTALLLALVCITAHLAAACQPCPRNYKKIKVPHTQCGFVCATELKLNCLPQPWYSVAKHQWQEPRPATAAQKAAAEPRICGGDSPETCPSIACAFSRAYAISGPLGCAVAKSQIVAYSASQTKYNTKEVIQQLVKDYQNYACKNGYSSKKLKEYAKAAINVYAEAIAYAWVHYHEYVCTCCLGNSAALAEVGASVQAVATAQAEAYALAEATINDCSGKPISISTSDAQAAAEAVELAINNVYKEAVSYDGKGCREICRTKVTKAIAKASACVIATALATAGASDKPGDSASCSKTVAISGDGYSARCNIKTCY